MIARPLCLFALLFPVFLGACTYSGEDDPVSRRFSWFSYLDGVDLRQYCVPGAADRYRFVYNAVYIEQVRTYEMTAKAGPDGHLLKVRVIGSTDLRRLDVKEAADLMAPWRGREEKVWLRDVDLGKLKAAMAVGGVFEGAPKGMELASEDFYWIVAACAGGRFSFNAYKWPSERFDNARFAGLLLAWDPTGVKVNEPRKVDFLLLYGEYFPDKPFGFNLRVGDNGLWGVDPLF